MEQNILLAENIVATANNVVTLKLERFKLGGILIKMNEFEAMKKEHEAWQRMITSIQLVFDINDGVENE